MMPESQHYCCQSRLLWSLGLFWCGGMMRKTRHILTKEVMVEDDGDAEEQFGVDGGPLKEFIDIRAVTIKFASEPADGSFLPFKFFLDELTNVQRLGVVLLVHDGDGEPAASSGWFCLESEKSLVHHKKAWDAVPVAHSHCFKALALAPPARNEQRQKPTRTCI